MTPEQIRLIKESWETLAPLRPAVGDLAFGRLFEIDPEVRVLFVGDLDQQKSKLMVMLGTAVCGLCRLELLVPTLEDLGRRHRHYGVHQAHYEVFGASVLWALEQALGPAWGPEVRAAWGEFLDLISAAMIKGSREAQAA